MKLKSVAKYQNKIEEGPLGGIKKFSKKSHKAKKGGSLIVERGYLLLWKGFVLHVRGFGCVQNQVLSTYRKSAQGAKS